MLHRWFLFQIHSSSTALATTRKPRIRLTPLSHDCSSLQASLTAKDSLGATALMIAVQHKLLGPGRFVLRGAYCWELIVVLSDVCLTVNNFSKYNVGFAVQKVLQFQIFQSFVSPALIVLIIVCCVSTLRLFFPSFQALSQSKQFGK